LKKKYDNFPKHLNFIKILSLIVDLTDVKYCCTRSYGFPIVRNYWAVIKPHLTIPSSKC